jgi:hypothetical protein
MKNYLLILSIFMSVSFSSKSTLHVNQNETDPDFTIIVSKTTVDLGEPFLVTFYSTKPGKDLKIDLDAFILSDGPYNSSSTSVVNGVAWNNYSLKYVVEAKREGDLILGPAIMNANGQFIKSNKLIVHVNSKAFSGDKEKKKQELLGFLNIPKKPEQIEPIKNTDVKK